MSEVGYLLDAPGIYPDMTTVDHLGIAVVYRGLSHSAVDEVLERLGLGRYERVRARALSRGNRQRLGLAMAVLPLLAS